MSSVRRSSKVVSWAALPAVRSLAFFGEQGSYSYSSDLLQDFGILTGVELKQNQPRLIKGNIARRY
jgi:hypothetical protein